MTAATCCSAPANIRRRCSPSHVFAHWIVARCHLLCWPEENLEFLNVLFVSGG
jgi:hypothetical protein